MSESANNAGPYFEDWADTGQEGMIADFRITADALNGAEVLVASYLYEAYSGDAYVLFRRDGKLFEVHGSHCFSFGLEDQWEPSEVTPEELFHRMEKGTWRQEADVAEKVRATLFPSKEQPHE